MKAPELPSPDPQAAASSDALAALIHAEIASSPSSWISFARFMELALYAPMLGYYSGGAQKFGGAGDFVTAPELTPLFGATLARFAQATMASSTRQILEFGAGSGLLAAHLLGELQRCDALPQRYFILDLSGELRARQHATLSALVPGLVERVEWLDALPAQFSGLMLGNEVLDAMPVHLVRWHGAEILERGVASAPGGAFEWSERLAYGPVLETAARLPVAPPYLSEVGLAASAWLSECGRTLTSGALLLLDYGFPRAEFYHPQRRTGTLMCHYRHRSHTDPFWYPGLNDITSHVDFTAIAEAGVEAGLELVGYTSQAAFLIECGMLECLQATGPSESIDYLRAASSVQKMLSPSEMGELFKVIAFSRGIDATLPGFATGDRSYTL